MKACQTCLSVFVAFVAAKGMCHKMGLPTCYLKGLSRLWRLCIV